MAPAAEVDTPRTEKAANARQTRPMVSRIMAAFHHACDVNDAQVAERLLHALETAVGRQDPADPANRRELELLVAAHDRFWHLRRRQLLPWERESVADRG